jgi:peptidoglycan/LPS O-acetylase OafA/YrhL
MTLEQGKGYRNDIDGLRALAVLAVIVFHAGYLPNGYLGVDVFFVISGFLITGIIHREIQQDRFSIIEFYLRRTRRILPLALFVSFIALVVGVFTMLPDDLENLSESVLATNAFGNNVLQAITTKNYWDVVNDYKPLMHTWSLGVEEQFYLVYPFLLIFVMKTRPKWALVVVSFLALVSVTLYFLPSFEDFQKFYLTFFRFWELAAGGIVAIGLRGRVIRYRGAGILVLLLVGLMAIDSSFVPHSAALVAVVLLSAGILASLAEGGSLSSFLLESKLAVAIGKISFSLYMWHQVLLAYARYFWVQELSLVNLLVLLFLTVVLSLLSNWLIEQPFRNRDIVKNRVFLLIIGGFFFITSLGSGYIYANGGVVRDVPELGIRKGESGRNIHAKYNARVYGYDKNFASTEKLRVLVIGNSFARDWANVLIESNFAQSIEISYIYDPFKHKDYEMRANEADVVFYSMPKADDVELLKIPSSKLWVVGTKNFGVSNGIFYNNKGPDYFYQRTPMAHGQSAVNQSLRVEWGDRYLDYIAKVADESQKVPIFTPSGYFISQDCRHFTKEGAQYFAQLFDPELKSIFRKGG